MVAVFESDMINYKEKISRRCTMFKKEQRKAGIMGGIAIMLLCIVICVPVAHVGAKELVVKVGVLMDQTGPLASPGRKGLSTWLWYQEYFNSEVGGWKDVKGNRVKLKVLYGDTGFQPARTIALYKKFKAQGAVAMANIGSVELAAIRAMCLSDQIPVFTNSGSLIYPLPSPAFGHWPDYSACSAGVIDYIADKWAKSQAPWTKKRRPRLAFIGPEGYPSWAASITPEVMRYAKLKGVDVVGCFFIPLRPIDTKPQILAAKTKGADFIYTGIVISQAGAVIRDLIKLGFKGDPTKEQGRIEPITMFPVPPKQLITMLEGRKNLVQDVVIVGAHGDPWSDAPAMRLIRKYARKHGKLEVYDDNYVHEWWAATRCCKAIELALREVPANKLKGSDVMRAAFRIKDLDSGGVLPDPVTFTEEERIGIKRLRIDKIQGERRKLVGYFPYKMLAPMYTKEYAKAHGKKSIYSEQSLQWLSLSADEVGYERIKE